jgi:O-antigen/teichoic acid export membrane protein
MSGTLRASVAGSVAWAGLESGLSLAISVGSVLAIARLLGASEFGLGSLAHGLVQIPLVLVGSLVHDALVQRAELSDAHWRAGWTASLAAGLVLTLLALGSAPLLAALFDEPRLGPLIAAFAPLLLLEAISSPLLALRRRGLDFGSVARRLLLGRGLGAAVGVAVAALGGAAWAIVAQQLVAAGSIAVLLHIRGPARPRGPLDRRALVELLRFCRPIVLTQLVIQGSERLFLAYVGHQLSLAAAGYWSLAVRLVENIAGVVMTALYHVGLAFLSRLQADRATLLARLDGSVRLLMLAAVPAVAGLLVTADLLVALAVGPGWTAAAPAVQILALGALLLLRRLLPTVALTAAGRPRVNLEAYVLENGLTLPFLFLLGPVALPAVAAIRAARAALGYVVVAQAAARGLGRSWRTELGSLANDLVALAVGVGAGALVRELVAQASWQAAWSLLATATAAALPAAVVALLLQPSLARGLLHGLVHRRAGALQPELPPPPLEPLR